MYFITDLGMYDNLNMRLTRMEVGNVNFLNEIPQFCNNIIFPYIYIKLLFILKMASITQMPSNVKFII